MTIKKFFSFIYSTEDEITHILASLPLYYKSWSKEKRDKVTGKVRLKGGEPMYRSFNMSTGRLRAIQNILHENFFSKIEYPEYVQGSISGRSAVLNAKMHQGNKYKFQTDIADFFPSITTEIAINALIKQGIGIKVATLIANLCTYKNQLPQGCPTSSDLANLVFFHLADKKIADYCEEYDITFTRYMDDLTFSAEKDFQDKIPKLIGFIHKTSLKISPKKTTFRTSPTTITGIQIKQNGIIPPPEHFLKLEDPTRKQESKEGLKQYAEHIKKVSKTPKAFIVYKQTKKA